MVVWCEVSLQAVHRVCFMDNMCYTHSIALHAGRQTRGRLVPCMHAPCVFASHVKPCVYHQCLVSLVLSVPCCATLCCSYPQALLKQEVLNIDAVEGLLGRRPFTSQTMQNIDRYRCASVEIVHCTRARTNQYIHSVSGIVDRILIKELLGFMLDREVRDEQSQVVPDAPTS